MHSNRRKPIRSSSKLFSTPTTPTTSTRRTFIFTVLPATNAQKKQFSTRTTPPLPPPASVKTVKPSRFRVSSANNAQNKKYNQFQKKRNLFDGIKKRIENPSLLEDFNLTQSGNQISKYNEQTFRRWLGNKTVPQLRSLYYETLQGARDSGLIHPSTGHTLLEFNKNTNIYNLNKYQLVQMILYLYSIGLIEEFPKTELQMLKDAIQKIIFENVSRGPRTPNSSTPLGGTGAGKRRVGSPTPPQSS